ncbi:hypothetical protein [Micromonospora sp. KLBMP9576]|uniref:hypothetical protein n=1 Tax=Micromonospora sp. KLBMP9576 TaxID=3424769 RepID=UPI003D8B7EB7
MNTYERLVRLLESHGARFRLIPHEPQDVTSPASRLRGHAPSQATTYVAHTSQAEVG